MALSGRKRISEVLPDDRSIPMDLPRLADPSDASLENYLSSSRVFLGTVDGGVVSVGVVRMAETRLELMNLAVSESHQGEGLGKEMLAHIKRLLIGEGLDALEVGTGNSSLGQLAFYQKNGFRVTGVERDFFRDYEPAIYEHGIRCIDPDSPFGRS